MDELLEILRDIKPQVDFEKEDKLLEDGLLDSLDIADIISAIERHWDITIDADDIDPDNFHSMALMWKMTEKYLA